MILSRPYADDDEMYEDERQFRDWARRRFGGGAEDYEYEPEEDDMYDE